MRKQKIKGILGVILILLALSGIILWENGGREVLTNSDVLVLKEPVQPGTVVRADMLGTIKMDRNLLIEERVTDYKTIVGLVAKNYIPAKLQLSKAFFEEDGMMIGNGQYVCALPKEWLRTYPQTLRQGDTVYFYEIAAGNEEPVQENAETAILNARVAFVKDSTNREVIDVTAVRLDGSAAVANIEVILRDEEFLLLRNSAEAGHQFILAYE